MGQLGSKNLEECLREEKRNLNRSIREIEREIFKLENEQKGIEKNISVYAKKNDIVLVRSCARDLVKIKQTIAKYSKIKSHLFSMKIKLQTVKSSEQLTKSVKEINVLMNKVNKYMKVQDINTSINEFHKQNNEVSLKEGVLDDLFDTMNYDIDTVEQEDEVVSKVLDELGIQMNAKLTQVPDAKNTIQEEKEEIDQIDNLEERINNLKKT